MKINFKILLTVLFVALNIMPAYGITFDETWQDGSSAFAPLMDEKTKTGKPIILYFYTDW